MAVTLRYFTEFGKHTFQHITAASSCGGIYAGVYCILYHVYDLVVKKVHVRYLISWWVSCFAWQCIAVLISSVGSVITSDATWRIKRKDITRSYLRCAAKKTGSLSGKIWEKGMVVVSTSRSRDNLETYQRLVSVSSREKSSTSRSRLGLGRQTSRWSRLGLGHLRLVPKTIFHQIVQATVRSVKGL